ncbi:hypothetical protein OC842_002244 [Tilletia horrida]|uniref:Uncharacterized protein n=1 Tax=Tilletia horrida TaxID=155126 RepID=A0AAN6GG85_9BASI|nr:hypothetical protein OC842_002244 [Tilletia horrida]KAK0549655.1 hypothetical protein OC844_006832 [Tilletia horrida]
MTPAPSLASRSAIALARAQGTRRVAALPARTARPVNAVARRNASSSPSVSDPKITAKLPQGTDSIWAISSVVVFGSLFFYLTSPGSKKDGHGHGSHGDHKQSSSTTPVASPEEADEAEDKPEIDFVVVEEPVLNVKTPGGEILKERQTDDHGKQVSANNKSAPLPNRGETFKHGVAAAKDGEHISNPKAVVARAHEEKEQKYGGKTGSGVGTASGEPVEDGDDDDSRGK